MKNIDVENLIAVIFAVHAEHADDLCWLDIDKIFLAAGLPIPDRKVGDKNAMLKNCERFISEMCKNGNWKSYAELELENEKLKAEIEEQKREIEYLNSLTLGNPFQFP